MTPIHRSRTLPLIASGQLANASILHWQTAQWGLQSQIVSDSRQLFAQLQQQSFDLLILDAQMPALGESSGVQRIQQLSTQAELPILLLTTFGHTPAHFPFQHQIAAYLSKPIKENQLLNTLCRLFTTATQTSAPPRPLPANLRLPFSRPLRILLAEDNVVNQKVALQLLQRLGCHTDVAENGRDVLRAVQERPYDVILMDVQMPEMDGLEATRRIRSAQVEATPHPFPRPWIIAMTANSLPGDCEACLQAGMDSYLSKPVRLEELATALSQCPLSPLALADNPTMPREIPSSRITSSPQLAEPVSGVFPALDTKALQALQEMAGEGALTVLAEVIDCYLQDTKTLARTAQRPEKSGCGSVTNRGPHFEVQ